MITRRTLCLFVICSLFTVGSIAERQPLDRPNIIVFFLDDSGYGDYSHTGNPVISTPNISKLAYEGISFTQFYTSSPACSASRYSLLTGRVPGRSGFATSVLRPDSKRYLHPKEITLAEGLKARGYKTAMFGKWHLGNPNINNGMTAKSWPLAHGFDQWLGTNVSHDYDVAALLKSDPKGDTPIRGYRQLAKNLPSDARASASLTGLYTASAEAFVREYKDQPFFAYIAYNQPHLGLYVSDKFKGRSRRGLLGDVMAELDASVGRILKAVEEAGIQKNTLIIFSSDNGPWIRFLNTKSHPKYGEARMNIGYAMPFRDGKGSNWEGGHRVPGIFHWPGTIKQNTIEQSPASTMDILPTIFKLVGVDMDKGHVIDGRDIRPYLAGQLFPGEVESFNFVYSNIRNEAVVLRQGPWKIHTALYSQTKNNYGFEASREKPLLFQIENDISERIDRAEENPLRVKAMLKSLDDYAENIKQKGSFWDG